MATQAVLIGFGAVGRAAARQIGEGFAGPATLVGVVVRDPARHAADQTRLGIPFLTETADAIALHPDVAIEAGSHAGFRQHVPALLAAGIDVIAISVGAMADPELLAEVERAAIAGGSRLRIPSGAIAGLDAISAAAAAGGLQRVVHSVRKPPRTLLGEEDAEAVIRSGEARVLYDGPARAAAAQFPANVNVVVAVSIAGIGLDRTECRVIADPAVEHNTHDVEIAGDFGRLQLRMQNIPSDDNPKSGRIVALSLVRALRARTEPIIAGG